MSREKPTLTIELVPSSSWYNNVRSNVPPAQWDQLRHRCYQDAGHHCEICGGQGPEWPVECHEIWQYNKTTAVQRLVRLIALCPRCHEVKHIGLTEMNGGLARAVRHLAKVNGWTKTKALRYVDHCYDVWNRRSLIQWTLDLSWLDNQPKNKPGSW
jgi:hypothetical protein